MGIKPDATSNKETGRAIIREMIPLALVAIAASIGCAVDAFYTLTLAGALLAALVSMRTMPAAKLTFVKCSRLRKT